MPQNIEQEVNNLVQVIRDVTHTNKIYLFGSYAYGTPNEDSDIDLCIVTDDKDIRKIDLMKRIRKAIAHTATMPTDILVYYADEFLQRATLPCTMEHKILDEGIRVYG